MLSQVGETLDHLLQADLTFRQAIPHLYRAATSEYGTPLTMRAAKAIYGACEPGARALILTGWPSRSWLFGNLTETDGPVGAAVLARVLEEGLDAIPIIGCDTALVEHLGICTRGAGLILGSLNQALKSKPGPPAASVGAVVGLPEDEAGAEALLDYLQPSVVIAIEMPGPGPDGHFYTVSGRAIPLEEVPRGDLIYLAAKQRGILTVGIGDGGNELGMGGFRDRVADIIPHGDRAVSVVRADEVVVGSNSNWASQGLAAALLAVTNRADIFARLDIERIINLSSDNGAIDGLSARVDRAVDGTPAPMSQHLWGMMALAVQSGISGWLKG